MSHQGPASYRELLVQREQVFHAALAAGKIDPFVYPWDTIPAAILILAVLFVPRLPSPYSRWVSYLAFLLILFSCISVMQRSRSPGIASGYGIGLMCVWGIVWSAVLLLYNDPKTAFKRLEWRDIDEDSAAESLTNGSSTSIAQSTSGLKNRIVYGVVGMSQEPAENSEDALNEAKKSKRILIWQSYPENFRHRLDWVLDLCTSFRGPGWNWRIQTLPEFDHPSPSMLPTPPSSTKLLIRIAIRDFLFWYLAVDIIKTVLMSDPYFWGIAPLSFPVPINTTYLPTLITNSPPLTKFYRLLLSLTALTSILSLIFTVSPLFFALLLPTLKLTQYFRAPLLSPLLYPPYWGDFTTTVLDQGLAGWWGKWWHQMFRMGISEPARVLVEKLGWDPRRQKSKVLQLLVAFGVSGAIHAGASYTALNPETRPFSGPFAFFFMQGLGILAERFVFKTVGVSGLVRGWPRWVRRLGTLVYVLTWCYVTGPWLADDFARSEIWLLEPVPVSVVRGLGLGAQGEGWWCWHGVWATWWSGREGTPWWRKGIAL